MDNSTLSKIKFAWNMVTSARDDIPYGDTDDKLEAIELALAEIIFEEEKS